jgi:hypothetical protein
MKSEEQMRLLFARFLYSWILISLSIFILWISDIINTRIYSTLWLLTTIIMIIWLIKIVK